MDSFEFIDDRSFKIDLKLFSKLFSHELKYLNEYFKLNNEMLIKKREELDLCLKHDIYHYPELKDQLKDFYEIDYIKIPCYLYNSAIVSLYSLLENNIISLCNIIQLETNSPIGFRDLAGFNVIEKGKFYLEKIANLDFEKLGKEWSSITDFQKLRNLIVHNNAQMKNPEQDIKLMSRVKIIRVIEQNFYIKDISLVYEFLGLIEKFIISISDQIGDRKFKKFKSALEIKKFDIYDDLPF